MANSLFHNNLASIPLQKFSQIKVLNQYNNNVTRLGVYTEHSYQVLYPRTPPGTFLSQFLCGPSLVLRLYQV